MVWVGGVWNNAQPVGGPPEAGADTIEGRTEHVNLTPRAETETSRRPHEGFGSSTDPARAARGASTVVPAHWRR